MYTHADGGARQLTCLAPISNPTVSLQPNELSCERVEDTACWTDFEVGGSDVEEGDFDIHESYTWFKTDDSSGRLGVD
jgi:hypothetical protein